MNAKNRLRQAVMFLRTLHPQLRVSQIDILLSVWEKEGQSQTELAENCDLTVAAISRAVDALGTSGRRDGKGSRLGLIRVQRDPQDDRYLLVFLTDKGRQVLDTLSNLVYPE
jgi:DNA-binding MarR family transcriptional regulator